MTKAEILAEIRRTASQNGGVALGQRAFERRTGIRRAEWLGLHWRSWGDAVSEAGFPRNTAPLRIGEDELLKHYCLLARNIGRFPTQVDFRMKKQNDPTFPSETTFVRRIGSFPSMRARARRYCLTHPEFDDVAGLLEPTEVRPSDVVPARTKLQTGFVYLLKHGSRAEYKIGKTLNPLRREGEIGLQLPEKLLPVHHIETDDPAGIETYWFRRFASKRKEGEWFALTRDDIAAFKRWKRIV